MRQAYTNEIEDVEEMDDESIKTMLKLLNMKHPRTGTKERLTPMWQNYDQTRQTLN